MLRRARWLILLAIVAIAATVGSVFFIQKEVLRRNKPTVSKPLPFNSSASANLWEYEMKSGDNSKLLIRAAHFEQVKDPPVFQLDGLEMEIRKADGSSFNLIKSAKATFDQNAGTMLAPGDVEITLGLPTDPAKPHGRVMKIRTSNVTLEVRSSKASTDRHADFEFDQGSGSCVGAMYDPQIHELEMQSQVRLDWLGKGPGKPPMHIEASKLLYRESSHEVFLSAPSRLSRGEFNVVAEDSVVFLNEKTQLDRVEARKAVGTDKQKTRQVDYQAGLLFLFLTPKGEVKKIEATEHARLKSVSPTTTTKVEADRLDLEFEAAEDGSILKHAIATGKGRVESQPVPRPGVPPQGARVLTSEAIDLVMREGGKEIERVETHAPGQVEFLPGKKGDPRRTMNGDRLQFTYAENNVIRSATAINVKTRTDSVDKKGKPVVTFTQSKGLSSEFDPKTGELLLLEQWDQFEYTQGAQRATAAHATLEQPAELIRLKGQARMWDETGSTTADEIQLDQKTGAMTATGNVNSVRMPDKQQSSGGMLSASEPLNARAASMTTANRNQRIRYDGSALLWQGNNRLRASTVLIDREAKTLNAAGNVVTEMPDQVSADAPTEKQKKKGNAYTIIRAPSLTYADKDKFADYTGGTTLERPNLLVKSRQLRAWFEDVPKKGGGSETRLDKVFCDGAVDIKESTPGKEKNGSSEHAEYYPEEERFLLTGGNPMVVDAKRGTSRGAVITWYSRQDLLEVDNSGAGPAVSRVNQDKKKKK
ncbi:MAG: hypothetical protein HY821_04295 [Acidobacteria bacterium]|nr:hypothetical protein [Acidobacteriota bacterium]